MNEQVESTPQSHDPKVYERLDYLNDEFAIIRRWMRRTDRIPTGPDLDVLRLAVDRVHSLYEHFACELRQSEGGRDG